MDEKDYIGIFNNSKSSYIQIVSFSVAGIAIMLAGIINSTMGNNKIASVYGAMALLTIILLILHLNAVKEMKHLKSKISDEIVIQFFIKTIYCSFSGFFILFVWVLFSLVISIQKL